MAPTLKTLLKDAVASGAIRRRVVPESVEMMLAEIHEHPFNRKGWIFETKLDGYRLVSGRTGKKISVISRNGLDLAPSFPEVVRGLEQLEVEQVVLDGEVVAMDEKGRPSFQRLQNRGKQTPTIYYVFDLLGLDDLDLRPLPLVQRKAILKQVIPAGGTIRYLDHYEDEGEPLYQHVLKLGLEGIVAKKAECPYRGGRSSNWLKIRADRTDDFVVVGYTQPKGARTGFGALHLGQYVGGKLVYSGRAGTGFNGKLIAETKARLDQLERKTPPCEGPVPLGATEGTIPLKSIPDFRTATWVDPALVCEVRFKEWTDEGYLRQPAFLRFRSDKKPAECVRQVPSFEVASEPMVPPREAPRVLPPVDQVKFSNRNKVFWPEDGYTKGDLIDYYQAISPWLLPYLARRPVVLTRFPDGIHGKSFFQKDAPNHAPEWLRTERMWSEYAQRDIDYFVVDNVPQLLYLANMAAIPLHIWASHLPTITHPDWCSLDLDPKDAPFSHVIEIAQAAEQLCRRIGLPAFIKTTGSSGLHVMMPLGRQFTHEQARSLAEVMAQALVRQLPKIATTTRAVNRRGGKVYVDYMQNGHGKLLVAPFSVRSIPRAPVSMPLLWGEVNGKLEIRAFTIKNAVERLTRLGRDPLIDVMTIKPDLSGVLEALQQEL